MSPAPLDPFQAFVDSNGLITREWYSWLLSLWEGLAVPGTAEFTGGTTAAVTFAGVGLPDQADTDYMIHVEPISSTGFWPTAKTTSGFTLNASAATTGTVRWTLVKF